MKLTILSLFFSCIALKTFGQETHIPKSVRDLATFHVQIDSKDSIARAAIIKFRKQKQWAIGMYIAGAATAGVAALVDSRNRQYQPVMTDGVRTAYYAGFVIGIVGLVLDWSSYSHLYFDDTKYTYK